MVVSTLQVLTPSPDMIWVQDVKPVHVPLEVASVPGVRVEQPQPGYACWRVHLPRTVWWVDAVRTWLGAALPAAAWQPSIAWGWTPRLHDLYDNHLLAHQRAAVDYICTRGRVLLGDQMGLGKTLTSIVAASVLRQGILNTADDGKQHPVVIVAPKALRGVWQDELRKWAPPDSDRVYVVKGTRVELAEIGKLRQAAWIFVHYDVVHAWYSYLLGTAPSVLIIDEAHLVKNPKTRRGKAVALAASLSRARVLLTGTPILNRIGEFQALLELTTGPWTWGSGRDFRERYAGAEMGEHGLVDGPEVTHVEELQQRLRDCYLRRTTQDAGLGLPALTRTIIPVELTPSERLRYEKLVEGRDPALLLRQLALGNLSSDTLTWLGRLRKLTSQWKRTATIAQIESLLAQGEQVVCFTWERQMAEYLARHCGGVFIHGGVAQRERDALVGQFQTGTIPLIVATAASLSVGVTLHRARAVIMHDLDYVPATLLQAEARVYRIGQQRAAVSYWMTVEDSIDEVMIRAVLRKAPRIAGASGDEGALTLGDVLGDALEDERAQTMAALLAWARGG